MAAARLFLHAPGSTEAGRELLYSVGQDVHLAKWARGGGGAGEER